MFVIKRNGNKENVKFDKITQRIANLSFHLSVDPVIIAQKVIEGLYEGIHTDELDTLAAETAAYLSTKHPDYSLLAGRIAISNLHKKTKHYFADVIEMLYNHHNVNGKRVPLVSEETMQIVKYYKDELNKYIVYSRDYDFDYFGYKTLERSYLIRINGVIVERPQHMMMRVAIGIHGNDLERIKETYDMMSQRYFIHATPTLFNAGTPKNQLSSCFLLTMKEDSIEGIFDTLKNCAVISKYAGGIGFSNSDIRASGSFIAGTNGNSNGIVPMLKVYHETAKYVDQGGGKRKGSFASYLEPWHADVMDWLLMKRNQTKEEKRALDLYYGLWVPDLFMERVENDEHWSLMCPHQCPGLTTTYGNEFKKLYERYEKQGKFIKKIKAQELWKVIVTSQIETGTPYMLYKDECNKKSNQKNLGTIKGSNLCTEIIQFTSPSEIAVCNLASVNLSKFVVVSESNDAKFDFEGLIKAVAVMTRNLNKIIDRNFYPLKEAKYSNLKNRPIGLGVQGLADVYMLMGLPFTSEKAKKLNKQIFETIYWSACKTSIDLAKEHGKPYDSYEGSPISMGHFQFDLWHNGNCLCDELDYDWDSLRYEIEKHGIYNSLLVAPMPTASTSQILGNNECFEPYTSNIYVRRVLAGEFPVVNKHLVRDLIKLGLWNETMKNEILQNKGSVQQIDTIPDHLKEIYKTVWEIKQREIINMAADRAPFIDQSQSMNLHLSAPTYEQVTSMHHYSWKKGLKTGMYYLRTKPKVDAQQVTLDVIRKPKDDQPEPEDCLSCGA